MSRLFVISIDEELFSENDNGGLVMLPEITGEMLCCRDCKHFIPETDDNWSYCSRYEKKYTPAFDVGEEDYCSKAERKEER